MEKGLGQLFVTSSSSQFHNKADFCLETVAAFCLEKWYVVGCLIRSFPQVRLARFEALGSRILTGIVNNEEESVNRDTEEEDGALSNRKWFYWLN